MYCAPADIHLAAYHHGKNSMYRHSTSGVQNADFSVAPRTILAHTGWYSCVMHKSLFYFIPRKHDRIINSPQIANLGIVR